MTSENDLFSRRKIKLSMLTLILFHELINIDRLIIGLKNNYMKMTSLKFDNEAGYYAEIIFFKNKVGFKIILIDLISANSIMNLRYWSKEKNELEKIIANLSYYEAEKGLKGVKTFLLRDEVEFLSNCHVLM